MRPAFAETLPQQAMGRCVADDSMEEDANVLEIGLARCQSNPMLELSQHRIGLRPRQGYRPRSFAILDGYRLRGPIVADGYCLRSGWRDEHASGPLSIE